MAKKESKPEGMSLPIIGMLLLGVLGAVITAAQCEVIKYWPLPVSIAPYFGGEVGFWWGLVVGAVVGLFVGFISDEKHYDT
ncbi:MAG: hypothetical protein K2X81_22310 [Candidatus Obscuribacterales bacterium]|nr:hypothetical protein [Candidatus Obscuribacterales bacterium]